MHCTKAGGAGVTFWLSASLWITRWRGVDGDDVQRFFVFCRLESSAAFQPAHPHAWTLITPELSTHILSLGNTVRPFSFVQRSRW